MAVETPFSARFLTASLMFAETRGALLAVLGRWGGEVVEYEPARVKAAIVGYGRAEKRQMVFVVQRRLQLAEPPSEDERGRAGARAVLPGVDAASGRRRQCDPRRLHASAAGLAATAPGLSSLLLLLFACFYMPW